MVVLDYATPRPRKTWKERLPTIGLIALTVVLVLLTVSAQFPVLDAHGHPEDGITIIALSMGYLAFRQRRHQLLMVPFILLALVDIHREFGTEKRFGNRPAIRLQMQVQNLEQQLQALQACTRAATQPTR